MDCIFCDKDASGSVSVEHIIPESLGNRESVLTPGIVCDGCNNYFARKVEKPVLESGRFLHTRFNQAIESKKGRTPAIKVLAPGGPSSFRQLDPKSASKKLGADSADILDGVKYWFEVDKSMLEGLIANESSVIVRPTAGAPPAKLNMAD